MKTSLTKNSLIILCAGALAWLPAACTDMSTRESTGEYADDSKVTNDVKDQLIQDAIIGTLGVKVSTTSGVVSLTGFVNTPEQRARAGEIARGVPGVRDVKNEITLK
jgi:osmotically-inducible protein OsmY